MDRLRFFLVFIIGCVVYFYIDIQFFSFFQREITSLTQSKVLGHFLTYALTSIPLFATVAILYKSSENLFLKLGLSKNLWIGFAFAFASTLPMLIAYAIKFDINYKISADTLIINTISAAFFEEIIYRAFLFGMIYRCTRLGFLPSVFSASLLFGIAHLYQSTDFNELIGIFLVTFFGSVLFSWIYVEWKFNLWTAIFLHCLMNLYWLVFDADQNALGGTYANIFRFSILFLAIIITIAFKKKKQIPLAIHGKNWWLKPFTSCG